MTPTDSAAHSLCPDLIRFKWDTHAPDPNAEGRMVSGRRQERQDKHPNCINGQKFKLQLLDEANAHDVNYRRPGPENFYATQAKNAAPRMVINLIKWPLKMATFGLVDF